MNPCLFLLVLALPTVAAAATPAPEVPPLQRREPSVLLAQRLVAPGTRPHLPADLKNPFVLSAALQTNVAQPNTAAPTVLPDRQLLDQLAPLVNPSGTMQLNGEPILLFGQKRIKVGDPLPITFDGQPYVLVISAIQGTSFTLRLNGEETTRPIKPANRP